MNNNTQSRKWQITINNPIDKGYTHDFIIDTLIELKSVVYYCFSDEVGENGTFHTHIFLYSPGGIRFSTLLKRFKGGHFEIANGTCSQNRDYVFKLGKWVNDKKNDTNIVDSHFECGDLPIERQGKRNDLDDLYDMIKSGLSNYDIIESNSNYMFNIDKIDKCRQVLKAEEFKNTWRDIDCTYIFGVTGTGKTRSIMEKYGYSNVYRVTDYLHPFDSYMQQDVIMFEEFRSSLPISDMLKYLDGYPCDLPSRYNNKVACFTKIYIVSNIELEKQYVNIQNDEKVTYDAFLRRIHNVIHYTRHNCYTYTTDSYLSGWKPCLSYPKEFAN